MALFGLTLKTKKAIAAEAALVRQKHDAQIDSLRHLLAQEREAREQAETATFAARYAHISATLKLLKHANEASLAIAASIADHLKSKGVLKDVRLNRLDPYAGKLAETRSQLDGLTVMAKTCQQAIDEAMFKLDYFDEHTDELHMVLDATAELSKKLQAEDLKTLKEETQVARDRKWLAITRDFLEEMTRREHADRANTPRNPKVAKAAMPLPEGQSYTVPKGIRSQPPRSA